ncbi:MAG: response regulator transcription factor [Deltaproteobacteria bacterium]|nr:response regulator transcription factor [Deltaproteobacteria bacterium]
MATRILLADDHQMVREGLRLLIQSRTDLEVVAEASDGREAVDLARCHRPDIAVLDLWMPRLSGVEATRQIAREGDTRVLVLTMHESWSHVREALRAGALGYVVKSAAARQLLEAVDAVRGGRAFVSPAISHHMVEAVRGGEERRAAPLAMLTDREREVLQLVAEGLSSKEIATQLGLSVKTAETHRANLMTKLSIRKTSGLVRLAIREGLVAP